MPSASQTRRPSGTISHGAAATVLTMAMTKHRAKNPAMIGCDRVVTTLSPSLYVSQRAIVAPVCLFDDPSVIKDRLAGASVELPFPGWINARWSQAGHRLPIMSPD
jgi:hypothetical protein